MGVEPDAKWLVEVVYRKHGPAIFLAHLDVMRAFERGVRRARLPIAHSAGFNPRPRIVFASPLGVGASGDAELVCLGLSHPIEPADVLRALSQRMQPGIAPYEARAVQAATPPPYHVIPWADWEVLLPPRTAPRAAIECRCTELLTRSSAVIERERKGTVRQFDVRPLICSLRATADDRLAMRLTMGAGPMAKPSDIVAAMGLPRGSATEPHPLCHRLRLGPLPEGMDGGTRRGEGL